MDDNDVRDVIANALLWEEGSEWADGSPRAVKDADAVLVALAEAGLVVVPAEDPEKTARRRASRILYALADEYKGINERGESELAQNNDTNPARWAAMDAYGQVADRLRGAAFDLNPGPGAADRGGAGFTTEGARAALPATEDTDNV